MARTVFVRLSSGTVLETNDPSLWSDAKRIPATEGRKALEREAMKRLRQSLRRGSTVYTVLRGASSSGMSRTISLHVIRGGELRDITAAAARAMGYKVVRAPMGEGIRVGGCGMDMGFHLVYNLSRSLFKPRKPKPGEDAKAPGRANLRDGGYALNHRWA